MRSRRLWLLVTALLCLLATSRYVRALDLPELAEKTKSSVVHLALLDASGKEIGSGTGFFVAHNRVVTNHHVIADAASVRARLSDGRDVEVAGLLAEDAERDIAIIEVTGDDLPPALELGSDTDLKQGTEVVVIGSPLGFSGTLSTGIVSALRTGSNDTKTPQMDSWRIQITAAISPGSSGSPIMTRDGKVVAVAVGIIRGGAAFGFGVPIAVVKELLAGLNENTQPRPFAASDSSTVTRNLLISAAFFAVLLLAFVVPGWVQKRREKRA